MLDTIQLTNIRSYKDGVFEFRPGVNIIVGPNASGKTNLLEAIYAVCRGSGFKSSDELLINRASEWGRIDATLGDRTRTVKLVREPKSKLYVFDDIERKRLTHTQEIPVILFEPNHMLLLGGEPQRRRAFLDAILTQISPGYRKLLIDYKRVVAQRNRLLKQDTLQPGDMFVWDIRLSELAGSLAGHRIECISRINESLSGDYRSVSGGEETLQLRYDTKLNPVQYTSALLAKLKSSFDLDRMRGYTGSGPHRDDIAVSLDNQEARESASRGETRSIVLALKMSEMRIIKESADITPLLLLDDVFSELDGLRRRKLAEALKDYQTFITTTDADAIIKSFMKDYHVITTS